MSKLDEIALELEITLISLVEGFALQFLAGSASPILHDFSEAYLFPYIAAAIIFTLIFWAQAILHAISFIRWPVRVGHMFLYFVAAFVQVISFNYIDDPVRWFFWSAAFTVVIGALYVLDLGLIKNSRPGFLAMPHGEAFIAAVEERHRHELWTLVPVALAFNGGAFLILWRLGAHAGVAWFLVLGVLQMLVSLGAMVDSVRNFRTRAALISQLWAD